jgi:hypothetical protein
MSFMEQQVARTLARSKYPLAWFENYPNAIYERIKTLRNEGRKA